MNRSKDFNSKAFNRLGIATSERNLVCHIKRYLRMRFAQAGVGSMSFAIPRAWNPFHSMPIRAMICTLRVVLPTLLVTGSILALDAANGLAQDTGSLGRASMESLQQAAGAAGGGGITDQGMEQICQGAAGKAIEPG